MKFHPCQHSPLASVMTKNCPPPLPAACLKVTLLIYEAVAFFTS